jgi:hypothetical protein
MFQIISLTTVTEQSVGLSLEELSDLHRQGTCWVFGTYAALRCPLRLPHLHGTSPKIKASLGWLDKFHWITCLLEQEYDRVILLCPCRAATVRFSLYSIMAHPPQRFWVLSEPICAEPATLSRRVQPTI